MPHDKDDDTLVHFKVKRSIQMKKLIKAFCDRRKLLPVESMRFFYDGVRIEDDSTPVDVSILLLLCHYLESILLF